MGNYMFLCGLNDPNPTMKSNVLTVTALATLFVVACGPSAAEIQAAKEKATADSLESLKSQERALAIDAASSTVKWTGTMLGIKSHYGHVALTEANLLVQGPLVKGGSFTADIANITPLDSSYSEKSPKEGLIGHLKSPDFFATDSFPTATFVITSVEGNTATGDLTVRGKTNSEKVTDINVTEADGKVTVTGKLVFDRQKYGVAWSAGKDAVLNDNIELDITLVGSAQ